MAILKIARMGHPVLGRPALPVDDPAAPAIARLIEDMVDTLVDAKGAGLAAPQVHVPLRLVLFRVPPGRETAREESDGGRATGRATATVGRATRRRRPPSSRPRS